MILGAEPNSATQDLRSTHPAACDTQAGGWVSAGRHGRVIEMLVARARSEELQVGLWQSICPVRLKCLAAWLQRLRTALGTRWCVPAAHRQALLVLTHLRCGETYTRLA